MTLRTAPILALTPGLALALTLALAASAAAEDDAGPMRDGWSLIEEGTRLMLRGLRDEIDPVLRELQDKIGDLSAYHPPEILPNGDILIRRRRAEEPDPDTEPGGEIEL